LRILNINKLQKTLLFLFYLTIIFSGLNKIIGIFYIVFPIILILLLLLLNGFIIHKSFLIFLMIFLLPIIPTLFDEDISNPIKIYAIGRYSFCLFALIPFHFKKNKIETSIFENIYVSIIIMGGLSLLYQVIFGPIVGLAEPGERVGLVRYSTLMGSITVFSVAQPLALGFVLKNYLGFKKTILSIVLISLGLLSLSKTVLAGDILVILIYTLFNIKFNIKIFFKLVKNVLILILLILLVYSIIKGTILDEYFCNIFEYFKVVFGINDKALGAGQNESISENSSIRFLEYSIPSMKALYLDNGIIGFFFGGGLYYLGNAVLPFSEANIDMPHVNYIDFLVSGGGIMLIGMIFFIVRKTYNIIKQKKYHYLTIYLFTFFVLFTSSSFHFHPASSIIFYMLFFKNKI
jgi:hypothetical protein